MRMSHNKQLRWQQSAARRNGLVLAAACVAVGLGCIRPADAQEFSAKTVTLLVGFPPGGGYDAIARIFARHFGRYMPGTPGIVVQNQPGAGSLTLANLLYNTGPKDGSQMGLMASSAVIEPLLGNAQVKFDAMKFAWIGNLNRDTAACGAWHTSGIRTWDDAVKRGARFGSSGPAAITSQHALFLKNVLGVPFTVLSGFGGTAGINLAMQRGEVDATCGMYISSVRGAFRNDFDAGNLRIFIQFGKQPEPFFKDAANIYDLVKSEEDRLLTDFMFGQAELTRPLAAPPGTPAPIVAALRNGFNKTVADQDFLADVAKAQIEAVAMTGEETAARFASFTAVPKSLLQRAQDVVGAK